jgi:anti-sigma regulatory factor (Ser/Thr protein kinase)
MTSQNSTCLILALDDQLKADLAECVTVHGFHAEAVNGFDALEEISFEPDLILLGSDCPLPNEEAEPHFLELFIRERQIPILAPREKHGFVVEHFSDVHFYDDLEQATQMVLSFVLSHVRMRNMRDMMSDALEAFKYLQKGDFEFSHLGEAQALAYLIASMAPHKKLLRLGLTEVFVNAIEHGNLGIGRAEKEQLRAQGVWLEEVERRQASEPYKSRKVSLEMWREDGQMKLRLMDCGDGFDWSKYTAGKINPVNLTRSGRGIMFMLKSGLENIQYKGSGNTVEFSFEGKSLMENAHG